MTEEIAILSQNAFSHLSCAVSTAIFSTTPFPLICYLIRLNVISILVDFFFYYYPLQYFRIRTQSLTELLNPFFEIQGSVKR